MSMLECSQNEVQKVYLATLPERPTLQMSMCEKALKVELNRFLSPGLAQMFGEVCK